MHKEIKSISVITSLFYSNLISRIISSFHKKFQNLPYN